MTAAIADNHSISFAQVQPEVTAGGSLKQPAHVCLHFGCCLPKTVEKPKASHRCITFGCCGGDSVRFGHEKTTTTKPPSLIKRALMAPINFYQWVTQNTIYKWLGKLGIDLCLFRRSGMFSCSEYMKLAIQEHGAIKGTYYGTRRLLSCNPINGIRVQFFKKDLFDPAIVTGKLDDARKHRPEWLKHTKKSPLYEKYVGKDGRPVSRVKPKIEAAVA